MDCQENPHHAALRQAEPSAGRQPDLSGELLKPVGRVYYRPGGHAFRRGGDAFRASTAFHLAGLVRRSRLPTGVSAGAAEGRGRAAPFFRKTGESFGMDKKTARKIILLIDRVSAATRDRLRRRLPQDAYTHWLYLRQEVEAALDRGVDLRPSAKDACEQIRAAFPETCHYRIPF